MLINLIYKLWFFVPTIYLLDSIIKQNVYINLKCINNQQEFTISYN